MSETESEWEDQSLGGVPNPSSAIGLRHGLELSKLDEHLLRKGDDRSVASEANTVKAAVAVLSQKISESDLEDDDALNLRLARAAQTISNFLKLANLTISTEEEYGMLPGWMRRELVEGLDLILSERLLNALFLLRQQIRHLAIKRERVVSHQMVTLSDVVIAAIIDYVSCSGSSGENNKMKGPAQYPTLELAVRLPQRIDSLANFLATPGLSKEPDLNLTVKLGALAVLYCCRCLNPIAATSGKNLADCLSSFWLCAPLDKLPDLVIAHLLCVYMSSRVDFKDELHPFRPATNSSLWKLLIRLFPEMALISNEPLKPGQKILFSHGALLMPWIWWNRSLCPAQDSNWTLLWIRQEYSWLSSNSSNMRPFPSKMICCGLEGSEEISIHSRVVEPLLGNHAIGFMNLLKMRKHRNDSDPLGPGASYPDHITLVLLQIYSAVCDSPKLMLSMEEKDGICAQIEKMLQIEIDRSFESSARLDVIDMTLSLSQKACDRLLQSLEIKLHWLLESLLLEIEVSADPTCCQEESLSHQRRALSKSMFLTRCVEIRPLDEHLVNSSVINLVNILLTPLRCDHAIALAVTKLLLCISKSATEGKTLNDEQLPTVSGALIEVITAGRGGAATEVNRRPGGKGVEAGPLTAEFVKEYCCRFDYQMKYPLALFGALREELANALWTHSATQPQHEPCLSENDRSDENGDHFPSAAGAGPGMLIAEGMYALFTQFGELQRKFVQASPLTRGLLTALESSQEEIFHKLIVMLSLNLGGHISYDFHGQLQEAH